MLKQVGQRVCPQASTMCSAGIAARQPPHVVVEAELESNAFKGAGRFKRDLEASWARSNSTFKCSTAAAGARARAKVFQGRRHPEDLGFKSKSKKMSKIACKYGG